MTTASATQSAFSRGAILQMILAVHQRRIRPDLPNPVQTIIAQRKAGFVKRIVDGFDAEARYRQRGRRRLP